MAKKAAKVKKTVPVKKAVKAKKKPPLEPGMNVDGTPDEARNKEAALDWTNRVFASMIQASVITIGPGGQRVQKLPEPRIVLFVRGKSKSPVVWITAKKFAEMFKSIIESNKTDTEKVDAIAADEIRGYASFIAHCKKKGMFK